MVAGGGGGEGRGGEMAPLVAGALAGAANVASGYAFDTVKVRLQTGKYDGALHCFRHIMQTEGVRGLYQGLTPPLIGGAAETGVNYLVYSRLISELSDPSSPPGAPPSLRAVPLAGAGAGAALSFILGPTELLKCRLQTAGQHRAGPVACLKQLIAEEGPRGLARGLGATMAREIPGNALFFTVYEWLRRTPWFSRQQQQQQQQKQQQQQQGRGAAQSGGGGAALLQAVRDAGSAILCGGLAGVVMWGTILPLDVAKSRIQVARPGSPWDVGIAAHLGSLAREGGVRALWSGLAPTLARAFPANAAQWLAYELVLQQLAAAEAAEGAAGGEAAQR